MPNQKNLQTSITKTLHELGIPSNIKGYQTLDQVKYYSIDMAASSIATQYVNIVICLYLNQEYFH